MTDKIILTHTVFTNFQCNYLYRSPPFALALIRYASKGYCNPLKFTFLIQVFIYTCKHSYRL